jgi:hypothetical protein
VKSRNLRRRNPIFTWVLELNPGVKNRNLGCKKKKIRLGLWIFDSLEWKGEFRFWEEENPNPNFDFHSNSTGVKSKSDFFFSNFVYSLQEMWFFQVFTPRNRKAKSKSDFFCVQNLINSAFHSRNQRSWVEIRFSVLDLDSNSTFHSRIVLPTSEIFTFDDINGGFSDWFTQRLKVGAHHTGKYVIREYHWPLCSCSSMTLVQYYWSTTEGACHTRWHRTFKRCRTVLRDHFTCTARNQKKVQRNMTSH